ncbi:MAG: ABC transporter substrate-binding protein [Mariprofundales bacterium]
MNTKQALHQVHHLLRFCCFFLLFVSSLHATEIRVGMPQLPITLDPRFATDAASVKVQQFLHRGLTRLDDHFQPQPDVAQSWSHPSPLEWEFVLRPGVTFSDGTALTATDIAATLGSILDPALASPMRASFAAIDSISVLEPDRLQIHLHHPDASLLTRLTIGILPQAVSREPQQARRTVGCGAYVLKGWQGNRLSLQARARDAPAIVLVRVKDPVTRVLKLARGEIDLMQNDFPLYLLDWLKKRKNLRFASRPSTTFSYLGFNLHDPIVGKLKVRQALALALDRKRLKRALFNDAPVLAESVLPASHWATAKLSVQDYDPAKAKKLLDAAGLLPAEDGIRFHLDYRTSTDPQRLRLATAIAAEWRKIGVDVSVRSMEWGGFYARIKRGDFQLFSLAWVGIVDPDIYRWVLHSSMWPPKGANRGRYRNAQVDRWLDDAAASEDRAFRRQRYGQVEQQMQRDMVYIPLWYEPVTAVWNQRLKGFKPRADGSLLPLSHVLISEVR